MRPLVIETIVVIFFDRLCQGFSASTILIISDFPSLFDEDFKPSEGSPVVSSSIVIFSIVELSIESYSSSDSRCSGRGFTFYM